MANLPLSLSAEIISWIDSLVDAQTDNFVELIKISGLNPRCELRSADLKSVDFSNCDLRGYDLSDTDLRGAGGVNVVWDETTILVGAQLDRSIFAHRDREDNHFLNDERAANLLKRVRGLSLNEKVIWTAENLRRGQPSKIDAVLISTTLEREVDDEFTKSSIFRAVAPRVGEPSEVVDYALAALSAPKSHPLMVRAALDVLARYDHRKFPHVVETALRLLKSADERIRRPALTFLLRSSYRDSEHTRNLGQLALSDPDQVIRTLYIVRAAESLSEAYDLIVRHPEGQEVFDHNARISRSTVRQIARRLFRAISSTDKRSVPLRFKHPGVEEPSTKEMEKYINLVESMMRSMSRMGVNFILE